MADTGRTGNMPAPKHPRNGDRILIQYVCKDEDGMVIEDTRNETPAEITLGEQDVLPALEKHLASMSPGETKTIRLSPSQAFGQVLDDAFLEVPVQMMELDSEPEIGMTVEVSEDGDESCPGTIVEVNEDTVLVDCNHPLAGKKLTFVLSFIDFAR